MIYGIIGFVLGVAACKAAGKAIEWALKRFGPITW